MEPVAVKVYPSAPEALATLERALSGRGRPDGVISVAREADGGLRVEWNPVRTSVRVVMGVIDAELRRHNATRRTELCGDLTLEQLSALAAQELQAPDIEPERVLEALLARAGYDVSIEC